MHILRETTKGLHSHTYLINKGKSRMLAYRRSDDHSIQVFTKPLTFSAKFRTFETVGDTELHTAYHTAQENSND